MATTAELKDFATQQAIKNNVPVDLFLWQIGAESSWNPNAKNPNSTATGIAQFTNPTAKWRGVNQNDPYSSLAGAAEYMDYLKGKTGSWQGALNAYGTTHNDPAKQAQAEAILNKTQSFFYDETPSGDYVMFPNDESTANTANSTSGTDSDSTPMLGLIVHIIIAILGIALIIIALLNTDKGRDFILKKG